MKIEKSKRLQVRKVGDKFFIYNSIFGNLTEADENTVSLLESYVDSAEVSGDVPGIKQLLDKKFLLEQGKDEYMLLEDIKKAYVEKALTGGILRKLQFITSTNCNLNCAYCYEKRTATGSPLEGNMDFSIAKKAVDGFFKIINRTKQPRVMIRFFGGEPLVNWGLIEKTCEYIKTVQTDAEIVYMINTNGTLVTEHIAEYLSKNNFDVDVSLDAPNELNDKYRVFKGKCRKRGTFQKIDSALRLLTKYGTDVEVSAQLNDDNLHQMRDFIDYLSEIGVKRFEMNTLICDDKKLCNAPLETRVKNLVDAKEYAAKKGMKIFGKWIRLYNHTSEGTLNYCSRYGEQLSVNPSGEIYPCSGLKVKLGTVDDIDSIFNTKEYLDIVMRIVGNIPACRGCELEGMCVGGCQAAAQFQNPGKEGYVIESAECKFRKAIVAAQMGSPLKKEDPTYKSLIKTESG